MRFIHIADIHASRERLPQTLHILDTLTERAEQGDIDFIIFAGDFWDSTITATKGSGFSDIISAIRELEKHTYLYFIYGTPSHEPSGSLDAFQSEKTKIYSDMAFDIFISDKKSEKNTDIYFIPEPRRSNYIGKSAKEIDDNINKEISDFIESRKPRRNDYNRIVVYHGEVKGAVYQNGMSASSPTAISKELLQSLNADYYAFGHIHKPQEVFKNAWYSGSACPKDFGETHDGCYNLVEIENGKTKAERISFGLPTYETYDIFLSDFVSTNADYTNKHIRICFNCTKEEKKSLHIRQVADAVKAKTNALSVKLEPNIVEGEAAPKSEVVKRKSVVEKMTEYAKEKSLKMPKKAKSLLQDIQDNTLIKYNFPQHSFELLSLSLRGSIGIRDGIHKDDFELDFGKFYDGVVCLVGQNGRGKSTLVENCHPYPCMLTRDGTLKDHFYLKDSHRILVYKDENGMYYKISILIDGKNVTGKVLYFAETSKDRTNWIPIPDLDGSLESYKNWVESTFGTLDIYLRTAFFAKEQTRGATDISSTTKSERMELLSKLAGTEHLKEVSLIAREKRKETALEIEKKEMEISSYSHYNDMIEESKKKIESCQGELDFIIPDIEVTQSIVDSLKKKDEEYKKAVAQEASNNLLLSQYEKEEEELTYKQINLEYKYQQKKMFKKVNELNERILSNTSKIKELQNTLSDKKTELSKWEEDVRCTVQCINASQSAESKLKVELSYLGDKPEESELMSMKRCPTCGTALTEHSKEKLKKEFEEELEDWEEEYERVTSALTLAKKRTKEHENKYRQLCSDTIQSDVKELEKQIQNLSDEKDDCYGSLRIIDNYYHTHTEEEARNEIKAVKEKLKELKKNIEELRKISNTLEDVSDELQQAENELQEKILKKNELEVQIESSQATIEKCRQSLESIKDIRDEIKGLEDKIEGYNFIENSFSNNGIPAIELRESAPEISEIANKILHESYGNKFEIRFGSTSEIKAKRKVNEDFNILVYDTENGDEKPIDFVSSGERIWIKQALFYAFSIVQMNRTGFNFRVRIIDESDGSLDGGLRPKYLKMVTAAHSIASARITILITHSQEIKDIAQQTIEI